MKVENDLAKAIATAAQSNEEKLDASCKKMLSFKIILAWIMKTCVEEYKDISIQDIEKRYIIGTPDISGTPVHRDEVVAECENVNSNPERIEKDRDEDNAVSPERIEGIRNEDTSNKEGTTTFDIKYESVHPLYKDRIITMIMNIEAQTNFYPGYPIVKRGVYYACRMISAQYGTVFSGSQYGKIKKCYSLWVNLNPPRYRRNTINSYSLSEENVVGDFKERRENYDLITVGMICLGDVEDESCKGLVKMLSILFSTDITVAEKKQRLHDEFDIAMTKEMEEEANEMCDYSQMVKQEGINQGIAQGISQGITQGILSSIKSLMETSNMNVEQAMNALKIPDKDRLMYQTKLVEEQSN